MFRNTGNFVLINQSVLKKLFYRIFLVVNILFAIALVLSYLAVHINPDTFALPALFGLAYPYLLFINLIFALIWIVALRFEALISVVVIAAGLTICQIISNSRNHRETKPGLSRFRAIMSGFSTILRPGRTVFRKRRYLSF